MHFIPRPSRVFTQVLLLSHLGSWGVIVLLDCAWWIKLGGCAVVALSLLQHRDALRTTPTFTFTLEPEHNITLIRQGVSDTGILAPLTVVTPFLVLLRFKLSAPPHRTLTIPLFYDALPAADFRQLRMRLRFGE